MEELVDKIEVRFKIIGMNEKYEFKDSNVELEMAEKSVLSAAPPIFEPEGHLYVKSYHEGKAINGEPILELHYVKIK